MEVSRIVDPIQLVIPRHGSELEEELQVRVLVLHGQSSDRGGQEDTRRSADDAFAGVGRSAKPKSLGLDDVELGLVLLHRSEENLLGEIADRLHKVLGPSPLIGGVPVGVLQVAGDQEGGVSDDPRGDRMIHFQTD